jgi:bacterial/archaeal transporter family-2 protein
VTKVVALMLSAGAGALVAMQPPINSKLGHVTGTFAAATISFVIGTSALLVVALFASGQDFGAVRDVPWWYLTGGFIGAVFAASSLVTVRELGAGGVVAATIAGQLTFSVVIDQFGLLGLEQRDVSVWRVLGIVLLALGVYLIVRE